MDIISDMVSDVVSDVYRIVDSYWNKNQLSQEEIEERFKVYLTKLRITLIRKSPFYSNLLSRLSRCILATPEQCVVNDIYTAATDGRHIIFCPAFFAGLTSGEFNFIVMHELYHVLMNHPLRGKQLSIPKADKNIWNTSCDSAINPNVMDLKDLMNKIGLDFDVPSSDENKPQLMFDDNGNIRKESAETFYAELKEEREAEKQNGDGQDDSEQEDENQGSAGQGGGSSGACSDVFGGSSVPDGSDDGSNSGDNSRSGDGSGSDSDDGSDNSSDDGSDNDSGDDSGSSSNSGGSDSGGSDSGDDSGDDSGGNNSDNGTEGGNGSGNWSDNSADGSSKRKGRSDSQVGEMLRRIQSIYDDVRPDVYDEFYDDAADPDQSDLDDFNKSTFKDVCSKNRGSIPEDLLREYESMIKKVPVKWSTYLRRFLTTKQTDDVAFSTPNRVYLPHGYLRPDRCDGEGLDNISFYLDTSGSISQDEMQTFFNTAYSIAAEFNCTISVFLWHTRVYAEYVNIELDECKKVLQQIRARAGGTTYRCCVEHMADVNARSVCNVVLTDGYIEDIDYKIPKFIVKKTLIAIDSSISSFSTSGQGRLRNASRAGKVVSW